MGCHACIPTVQHTGVVGGGREQGGPEAHMWPARHLLLHCCREQTKSRA